MPPDPGTSVDPPPLGADGFYHPATEEQLAALVALASQSPVRQLRVRGAAHSVAHAIYTDPLQIIPNKPNRQTPPKRTGSPPNPPIDVMLDLYAGWAVRDGPSMLVEAEAGIHLGPDPNDPTGKATKDASLLFQLWNKTPSWNLSDLGGITHQTISGFTATGSSGGSLTYSASDDLYGFRVIDGAGVVHEFTRDNDPDLFYAFAPNLGLLGVVSKVILKCVDAFNISGQEAVTTVAGCAIDLFGPGGDGRKSLEEHLRDTEYTRIEWWPQPGADRVLVWQARRLTQGEPFNRSPYREFGAEPEPEEVVLGILLTILGNLDNLEAAPPQIGRIFDRVEVDLEEYLTKIEGLGLLGVAIAEFIRLVGKGSVDEAIKLLEPVVPEIEDALPWLFPLLLAIAIPLDGGHPQQFEDWSWHGLPMDNAVVDEILPTGFTEIWVPLVHTLDAMKLLRTYFNPQKNGVPDPHEALRRTGLYAWEFYAARPSKFWLSPSYTSGADDWAEGSFRIDPYWFEGNPGDPAQTFFPQLWELFRDSDIPFRLHWGKYQPIADANLSGWVAYFKGHYPRWDDFLNLRRSRDKKNTFLTSYWRDRLGISNESLPGE